MHWGILLLIGAGFAMADGSDASGFSTWVAKILADLVGDLEKWAIVLVVTIVGRSSKFPVHIYRMRAQREVLRGEVLRTRGEMLHVRTD